MPNRRTPLPDGDIGNWGNLLNDYLRQISDAGSGNTAGNFRGGLNNWVTTSRPTQLYSYTKTGGAGNETLGTDHEGLTGINTTTGQIERWSGTAWVSLTYPNLVNSSGNISITATTSSTSTTTGALTINGGLGVAENLNVGAKITAGGLQVTAGGSAGKVLTSDASGNATWQTASGVSALSGLSDVLITSITSGQFLKYNGTKWVNDTDGSTLTNLNASNIGSGTFGTARLGTGTANNTTYLRGDGTWATVSGGSATPAGANTQIQFNNSGSFGANANLVWDNTNSRLGIGTTSPVEKLEVAGAILVSGTVSNGKASSGYFDWWSTGARIASYGANTSTRGTFSLGIYASNGTLGLNVLQISNTGNIGIGTASPNSLLDLGQNGASATSSTTQSSSGILSLTGSYWTGSAETKNRFTLQNIASSTVAGSGLLGILWNSTEIMTLANDGIIRIAGTTSSTSATTGTLIVAGGVGIAGALNLGTALSISNGGTGANNATSARTNLDVPQNSNVIQLATRSGNNIFDPNNASYSYFGAYQWLDGSVTNLNLPSSTNSGSFLQLNPLLGTSLTDKYRIQQVFNHNANKAYQRVENNGVFSGWQEFAFLENTQTFSGTKTFSAITTISNTTNSTSTTTGALVVVGGVGISKELYIGGGYLAMANGTSNLLAFANNAISAPSFTTRSLGTKILLWNSLAANATDFAIGIESNSMWLSVPVSNTTNSFKWYGGTTNIATLDGTGNLTIASKMVASTLQITTGATAGRVLTSDASGNATWQVASGGSATPAGSNTQIQFNNSGSFGADANLVWDSTNGRLGIGTTSPTEKLQVNGNILLGAQSGTTDDNADYWIKSNGQIIIAANQSGSSDNQYVNLSLRAGTPTSSSTSIIAMSTLGVERMRITGNGNIGIGTTTPSSRLQVSVAGGTGDNEVARFSSVAGNSYITVGNGLSAATGGFIMYDTTNQGVHINTHSSGIGLFVKSNNVGIGTTTPAVKLHVVGYGITLENAGYAPLQLINTGKTGAGLNNRYALFNMKSTDAQGTNQNGFHIYAYDSNNNPTVPFTILDNSNVGIGTITPAYKLEVSASANATYVASFNNTLNNGTSNGIRIQAGSNAIAGSTLIGFTRAGDSTAIGSVIQNTLSSISYNTTSDIRLKENIVSTNFGLVEFMKLKVMDYNYIGDTSAQTGLIAQETYEIIPSVVNVGGEDVKTRPWGIDYGKLTPFIIKAVQEQQTQINNLGSVNIESFKAQITAENQDLKTEIGSLKGEFAVVKTELSNNKKDLENLKIELGSKTETTNPKEVTELKEEIAKNKTESQNEIIAIKTNFDKLKTEKDEIVTKNQEQQTQIETLQKTNLELKADLEKFKNQILAEITQIRQFSDYSSETQSQSQNKNSSQISSQNSSQNSQ